MEKDERLLPLPNEKDLQPNINGEYPASYSPMYDGDFGENRSIREYFNIVYKRLPLILALTVLVTTVVAFYMYRQPSVYEAATSMIIEPRKPSQTSSSAININFGFDTNYYNTQLRLLQNPDLMRDVVIQSGFYRQPNLFGNQSRGVFSTFRSIFSSEENETVKTDILPTLSDEDVDSDDTTQVILTPEEKALADRYTAILTGSLTVEQEEKTNIVLVKVRSTNPTVAAQTANQVVKMFIEQDIRLETQGAKQAYNELTKSIEDLRGTISGQELELINLLRSNNLPLQDKGGEFRNSTLQTAYNNYQQASNERLKIEARYNTAVQANANNKGTSIPDLTESKIYQDTIRQNNERRAKLQDRIREIDKNVNDAENDLAQLRVKYTDEYVLVQQKLKEIDELKRIRQQTEKEVTETIERDQKKLNTEAISGAIVGLRSQLTSAQGLESKLYSLYLAEEAKANVEGQAETRLTTLKREIETNRGLLDTYTQRQKEQELAITSSRPDNVKMSTEAQVPTGAVGPQRNRNIMIAFLISLAAGIGLAFLLDYLDDSVRSSDDVSRSLGLPTLAMIPYQSNLERGTKKRRLLNASNGNGNKNTSSTAMVTLEDSKSAIAEAYRHLRTSLLFSSAGHPPKTILVTSSQPAEGKTTTAINTAITLAQAGADVVIIDCDLRRPRLHSHFEMDNTHGLTNYLSGDRKTENLMKPFPGLPKLKVITSGPIPPNPTELLSSNEMKNLLQFLKGNYKHIIIDSPPAISFTDAAILSTLVDGVVLVAMVGKSSVHLMRRFKQRLGNIGARIYGVVLNGMKANSAEYGYYGYDYAYKYYTIKDDDDSTPLMEDLETPEEWEEEIISIHQTKG